MYRLISACNQTSFKMLLCMYKKVNSYLEGMRTCPEITNYIPALTGHWVLGTGDCTALHCTMFTAQIDPDQNQFVERSTLWNAHIKKYI